MNHKTRKILCVCALALLWPAPVTAAPFCAPETHRAFNFSITEEDMSRLHFADLFRRYLEAKGYDGDIVTSLYRASLKTGVDFELLALKAILESDMGQFTTAAHSTARGVFQYIEPTWLVLMHRYGDRLGYVEYAQAIKIARDGHAYLPGNDSYLRAEILALRYDADISALIKAYQIIEETDVIRAHKKNKTVNATDHYLAHLLGLPLTKEVYDLMGRNSVFALARLDMPEMREAARLNKQFFYSGQDPLNARDVYRKIEQRVAYEIKKIHRAGEDSCRFAQAPDLKTIR